MKINIKFHLRFQAKNISSSFCIAKNILKTSSRFAYNNHRPNLSNLTELPSLIKLEPILKQVRAIKARSIKETLNETFY